MLTSGRSYRVSCAANPCRSRRGCTRRQRTASKISDGSTAVYGLSVIVGLASRVNPRHVGSDDATSELAGRAAFGVHRVSDPAPVVAHPRLNHGIEGALWPALVRGPGDTRSTTRSPAPWCRSWSVMPWLIPSSSGSLRGRASGRRPCSYSVLSLRSASGPSRSAACSEPWWRWLRCSGLSYRAATRPHSAHLVRRGPRRPLRVDNQLPHLPGQPPGHPGGSVLLLGSFGNANWQQLPIPLIALAVGMGYLFLALSYDQVTPSPRNAATVVSIAHWLHPKAFGLPADRS